MSKIANSKNHESRDSSRQHKDGLHDLHCSPNINLVIKSRTTWRGHVARSGTEEMRTEFWKGVLRVRDHLHDPGADKRILHDAYKYEGRTESHEQQFFVKYHALLLTNQIHQLNLHNFLYFPT